MPERCGNARALWECPSVTGMPERYGNARALRECPSVTGTPERCGNARALRECPSVAVIAVPFSPPATVIPAFAGMTAREGRGVVPK